MNAVQIINSLIAREGGFVDNPADKGGPTCWGVTEAVARRHGYTGRMEDLPRGFAEAVYTREYIVLPGFDKVAEVSASVAEEMIDTGVNMGVSVPGPWLQRLLNALNLQARLYPDLVVDGDLGPATRAALKAYLIKRGRIGEIVLVRALNCMQGARYLELTEAREKNEQFFYGWMANRTGGV